MYTLFLKIKCLSRCAILQGFEVQANLDYSFHTENHTHEKVVRYL